MNYNQPQSYQEMFQMAMEELKRQTDLYFEGKKLEFDKYVDDKIQQEKDKCCVGGPQWGHAWDCKKLP